MPFDSVTDRTAAGALIPEDASAQILQDMPRASAVMSMATRLPDMTRAQRRIPVLSALPTAYFVDGDVGSKQTTKIEWGNKYVDAEEIAVIAPIPENVIDDNEYDMWGQIIPRIQESIGAVFDAAVFHGTNAPSSWPNDIATAAAAAGNSVDLSAHAGNTVYDALADGNGLFAKVEADGYNVRGMAGAISFKATIRGAVDANYQPLFQASANNPPQFTCAGVPIVFTENNSLNASSVLAVAGDWSKVVYAVRKDITYKVLDQAVIQDAAGNILYNLAQMDMIALRLVFRIGWQVPNPVNIVQATEASRYPLAILVP